MKTQRIYLRIFSIFILCVISISFSNIYAQKKIFTVVIDAGHGAHDSGAVGSFAKEKNINLAVSLELGKMIAENFTDVAVVYTRKKDIFIPLQGRADIANSNNADLFISIHTNSNTSSKPYGAETYTLGLAKTKANTEVARRENSVILLESDYKTKYKGFDPHSVDSYIMFEFMQDKFIDQSIEFASAVQQQFGKNHRYNRGVRQAGFWVLHATAAPAVLIELGFISNRSEEQFLASKAGQKQLATSIYNAFATYKYNFDKRSGIPTAKDPKLIEVKTDTLTASKYNPDSARNKSGIENTKQQTAQKNTSNTNLPIFKVQILASRKKLSTDNAAFGGLKNVDYYEENQWYKYTVGNTADYAEIQEIHTQTTKKHFDAFIIAFINGEKISVIDALKIIRDTKKQR
ncbi:MAG: N-acetylmuramoyl-L-alanine amidase [Prevotellaceae bacterium]|jgi:N-acetylmuramoyl-L-alanine amidase|nr:N-acetylmuramoyl-L-alanine amidase [Prevotellaceae bacterium]